MWPGAQGCWVTKKVRGAWLKRQETNEKAPPCHDWRRMGLTSPGEGLANLGSIFPLAVSDREKGNSLANVSAKKHHRSSAQYQRP